jgi:fermentation-respiration switch protein FrsA (DUF1100 family)
MKRFFALILLATATFSVRAQDVTGTWSGRAQIGAAALRLVFHITPTGATMDSPDQGAKGIPVTEATFSGDTLRLTVTPIRFTYTGVLRGETIEGSFSQLGQTFPLDLTRGEASIPRRPQEPQPPFPYRVEEVTFKNTAAGITLAGTLTTPAEGEGFPAVVLLTGSGAQNRDEELFGHKPFLVLADHFARHGIATLRFDDRGVGSSEGSQGDATSADFATDALAALDYLATRPEIDHSKTGFAGHSEGALIAFIAAAREPDKGGFVVSMAGPGVRGEEISVMQVEDILLARGAAPDAVRMAAAKQRRDLEILSTGTPEFIEANIDSIASVMVPGFAFLTAELQGQVRGQILASNTPWARFFMSHDPSGDLSKIVCPVMAVNGSRDLQVRPSVNLAAIRAGLEAGGNKAVTIVEYPGLNHLFQTTETGATEEYGTLEETFSPRVMEDIASWIVKTTK